MKQVLKITILTLGMLVILNLISCERLFDTKKFEFGVCMSKSTYQLGEPIIATLTLANIREQDLIIDELNFGLSLGSAEPIQLELTIPDGREFVPYYDDAILPGLPSQITIQAETELTEEINITGISWKEKTSVQQYPDVFKNKGPYSIKAIYLSRYGESMKFSLSSEEYCIVE
jgi:hypothetical protein